MDVLQNKLNAIKCAQGTIKSALFDINIDHPLDSRQSWYHYDKMAKMEQILEAKPSSKEIEVEVDHLLLIGAQNRGEVDFFVGGKSKEVSGIAPILLPSLLLALSPSLNTLRKRKRKRKRRQRRV